MDISEDNIAKDSQNLNQKNAEVSSINNHSILLNDLSKASHNFNSFNQSYRNDVADGSVDSLSTYINNHSLDTVNITKNQLEKHENKTNHELQNLSLGNQVGSIQETIQKNIDTLSRNNVSNFSADNMKFEKELNNQFAERKTVDIEEKINNNGLILSEYSKDVLEDFEL